MAISKSFLTVLTILTFVFLFYILFQVSSYNVKQNENQLNTVSFKTDKISIISQTDKTNQILIKNDSKVILLWTPMFGVIDWEMGYNSKYAGPDFFAKRNCPLNCVMTLQRDLLPSIDKYDAIVFHGVPEKKIALPSVRSPDQLYVHGILEAPPFVEYRLVKPHPISHLKNYYNLTMSFRYDF